MNWFDITPCKTKPYSTVNPSSMHPHVFLVRLPCRMKGDRSDALNSDNHVLVGVVVHEAAGVG